jgi:hypothetical protein
MAHHVHRNAWLRRLRIIFLLLAVALGALSAWDARHAMNPDGISYLDVGDACVRGDWKSAVNALWSPLYPCLTGSALSLVKPSTYWEIPLVHLVNFGVYVLALICFDLFLRELIRSRRVTGGGADESAGADGSAEASLPEWAWLALGYPLFMWASLRLITVAAVTPDMCVAACVYVVCAVVLRVGGGAVNRTQFVILGAVLGVGYLAKASFLPVALIFLVVAASSVRNFRRGASLSLLALVVFLSVSSVYYVPLSVARGRLTFGESGRLNYLWYVDGFTLHAHWRGETPGGGSPAHPTRKIYDSPAVYEFREPVRATYPPWYDPAYWYEGARARFDLAGQARVLRSNLKILYEIFCRGAQAIWLVGFLALFVIGCERWSCVRRIARRWNLLLPAVAAMGMYSLVHVEARYVGAFAAVLALGLFSAVRLPEDRALKRLGACVVVAVAALMTTSLVVAGADAVRNLARDVTEGGRAPAQWQVAESLREAGLRPGDEVASIGYGFGASWARLARVRIVAEITSGSLAAPTGDVDAFWRSEPAKREEIIRALAGTGAKVVVAEGMPGGVPADGWRRVGSTDYYIYPLANDASTERHFRRKSSSSRVAKSVAPGGLCAASLATTGQPK